MMDDESLDRHLHDAVPYIDDAGFTARVLSRLPAPARRPRSLRAVILVSIAMLGSALAYILSDDGRIISENIARLATLPTLWLLAATLVTGVLATCGGLIAALSKFES